MDTQLLHGSEKDVAFLPFQAIPSTHGVSYDPGHSLSRHSACLLSAVPFRLLLTLLHLGSTPSPSLAFPTVSRRVHLPQHVTSRPLPCFLGC